MRCTPRLAVFVVYLALILLPGCIAGAGLDLPWVKAEADEFRTNIGRGVTLFAEPKEYGPLSLQSFRCLAEFSPRASVKQGSTTSIGDLVIGFSDRRILVSRSERVLVDRPLPGVFYMHDLEVALHVVAGRRALVAVNHSRASTGRTFVGVYGPDGGTWYEAVLISGDVWDIQASTRGLFILGARRKQEVVFPDRN